MSAQRFRIAVHGGAGRLSPRAADPDHQQALRRGLEAALSAGARVLAQGGAAEQAVVAAVTELEDCPEFNAGHGSVLRMDKTVRADASLMLGDHLRAGAVANVRTIKNPIQAAQAVLRDGRHVLLVGNGAETFAEQAGLPLVEPAALITDARREQLASVSCDSGDVDDQAGGTVGAVALDACGGLAAATSTGGMLNALPARVGDSPIIGAGTWASNESCAVSATGMGEVFVRAAFAHEVDAQMRLLNIRLELACARALLRVRKLGGHGGCIAVDREGTIVALFTAEAMPRGWTDESGSLTIEVV